MAKTEKGHGNGGNRCHAGETEMQDSWKIEENTLYYMVIGDCRFCENNSFIF